MNHKIIKMGQLTFSIALITFGSLSSRVMGSESPQDPLKQGTTGDKAGSQQAKDPDQRLESLVVEVNGERRIVNPTVGLDLVAGDLLTIVDAFHLDKSIPVKSVDLVGYRSRLSNTSGDDRRRVIDTGRNLSKKRSRGGEGKHYRIEVSGPEGPTGFTFLNIREPELLAFEIEINGKVQKLVANEPLLIGPSDVIRVIDVRTNVRGNENVQYDKVYSRSVKEIRFSRGGRVFARIPIEWQGR